MFDVKGIIRGYFELYCSQADFQSAILVHLLPQYAFAKSARLPAMLNSETRGSTDLTEKKKYKYFIYYWNICNLKGNQAVLHRKHKSL